MLRLNLTMHWQLRIGELVRPRRLQEPAPVRRLTAQELEIPAGRPVLPSSEQRPLPPHARWPVGSVMQTGKEQLEKGLNRDLATGVHLTADVNKVEGLSVRALRTAIRLRAQADANARLTINQSR